MAEPVVGLPPGFEGVARNNGRKRNADVMATRLTADEIRVLRECNRESFYYRCMPIGTVAMLATHYAVKLGYLRANPRWGSMFKVIGAGVFAYFIGKFSYRSKCEEKLLQLPNSQLAELLRRRKQGLTPFPEMLTMDPNINAPDTGDTHGHLNDSHTGLGGKGTWEIDADKNVEYQGFDDSQRPSMDNPMLSSEDDRPKQSFTSYENLRKQNRDEYEAKQFSLQSRRDQHPIAAEQKPTTRSEFVPINSGVRNKYGDFIE